jgi:ribonuclease-3
VDSRLRAFIRERLGIEPREDQYYEMALTGWSITGSPEQSQVDKEEFLGDAVLGLAISELLMLHHPNENVGVLSASKASLVSGKTLSRKASALGLPELLKSRGVPLPSRMQDVLADVMESLIGAIYLDLGYPAARSFIERLYQEDFPSVILGWEQRDLKGVLQEILVREIGEMPDYHTRPSDGHSFVSEVFVKGRMVGRGVGGTKKEAEAHAAEKALQSLNQWLGPLIGRKPAPVEPAEPVPKEAVSEPPTAASAPPALAEASGEVLPPAAEPMGASSEAMPPAVSAPAEISRDAMPSAAEPEASSPEEMPPAVSAPAAGLPEAGAPRRKRRTRRAGRRIQARRRKKREAGLQGAAPEHPPESPPSTPS